MGLGLRTRNAVLPMKVYVSEEADMVKFVLGGDFTKRG